MAKKKKKAAGTITIEAPVAEPPAGNYETRHIEVQLTGVQPRGLKRLFGGLYGAQLANGRLVQTSADVVRWIMEQAAGDGETAKGE